MDVDLDGRYRTVPGCSGAGLLADAAFPERFRPQVVSSMLAVAWVAARRRATYLTDGPMTDDMHFASSIALRQAAGCVVTDLCGDSPSSRASGLIAAADAETHAALPAMVGQQDHGPPRT